MSNSEPSRAEHVAWCKARALEYCDIDDPQQAFQSMVSDMNKHDETRKHPANELGLMQVMGGMLSTSAEMRKFIEGYN